MITFITIIIIILTIIIKLLLLLFSFDEMNFFLIKTKSVCVFFFNERNCK